MLRLESPRWRSLEHAYGVASDIPDLLRQLSTFPKCENYRTEPYFSLWSALCHQENVYTASYAAVPHLIELLERKPLEASLSLFLLPCCIEIGRTMGMGPAVPDDLKEAYEASLGRLHKPTTIAANVELDFDRCNVLCVALAVSKGHIDLAQAILAIEQDLIPEFMEWTYQK